MQPLRVLFRDSYAPRRLRGKSASNLRQYEVQFRHFERFLKREPVLSDLTDDRMSAFLAALANGRAPATVNKARSHLLALWRYAARKRLVDEWPDVAALIEPDRVPEGWQVEQLGRLMAACYAQCGMIGAIPAGPWWWAVHWAWYSTGERRTATLEILRDNVDLDRGELLVHAEARKGKRKDMLYSLRPEAVHAIQAIWLPERKLLFPWPWCDGTFYNRYKKILVVAKLPVNRRTGPQKMRRSFASHLEAAGGNATEALGHSSRAVTKRSYLDPRITGRANHAALLPPIIMPDSHLATG